MTNERPPQISLKWRYASLIPIFIGLMCIIGWYSHIPIFFQLNPNISPMQFNTGLTVLLSGLAIFFYKMPFSKPLGYIAFIFALFTLGEYVFTVNLGIDKLFIQSFTDPKTVFSGRMAPNTALCLCLIGLMLSFRPTYKIPFLGKLFFTLCIFIILLSAIALFGYLIKFPLAYGWGSWAQMSPQAALSINLLGLALADFYWHKYNLRSSIKKIYPIIAILCSGAVVILTLWQYLVKGEQKYTQEFLANAMSYTKNTVLMELNKYYDSLDRMEQRLSHQMYFTDELWQYDANNYFFDMPALAAMGLFQQQANKNWVPLSLALQSGFNKKDILATCLLLNHQKINAYQHYICVHFPVIYKNKKIVFVSAIDMRLLINHVVLLLNLKNYGIEISINNQLLYKRDDPVLHYEGSVHLSEKFFLDQALAQITIWPYRFLINNVQTWFPTLSLLIGLSFISLLAFVVYILQLEREQSKRAGNSERKFRSVLNNTFDAILIVDANGKVDLANHSALKLFEFTELELLTKTVEDLMPDRFRKGHIEDRREYLKFPVARPMGIGRTLYIKTKYGKEIPVEIGLTPITINETAFTLCSIHNMSIAKVNETKLKEKNNLLSMLLDLANTITINDTHEKTLLHCLAIICTSIQWPIGHIYMRNEHNEEQLNPSNIWYLHEDSLNEFRKKTMETTLYYGQTLPGKVLVTGAPIVVNDITMETHFWRQKICERLQLHSAFAFPIKVNGKITAVAEFFTYQKIEDSSGLLLIGNLLSAQIGRFIEYQNILEQKDVLANRFKFAVSSGHIGVWDFDLATNQLVWDEQMYQLYEIDPQINPTYHTWEKSLHPDDLQQATTAFNNTLAGSASFNTEFRIITPSKKIRYIRAHALVRLSPDGKPKSILGLNWDITKEKMLYLELQNKTDELQKFNKLLEKQAYYDPLTNLMNRRSFTDAGNRLLARAKRHHLIVGFFFIDLDYFKKINDVYGHPTGDNVLIAISKRLLAVLRNEDIIGRLGGDEFAAIAEFTTIEYAKDFGKKIIAQLHQPIHIEANTFEMTTSIGFALFPQHGSEFKELMQKADLALLKAKENGRNRMEMYKNDN